MPADALDGLFSRLEIFTHLDCDQRREIAAEFQPETVGRGDVLLRQGDTADAMFIVVSGRFAVLLEGRATPISEIGPGQPIGEIAFLAGGARTATVVAQRDSLVLRLDRERFDRLTASNPALWRLITVALARRVTDLNAARPVPPDPRPRTLTLIPAGGAPIPDLFVAQLAKTLGQASQRRQERGRRVQVVDAARARNLLASGDSYDTHDATSAFNDLERQSDFVVYVGGCALDAWTDKAIRQADIVLEVGVFDADPTLNPLEARAAELLPTSARRLVLLHDTRRTVTGTKVWLKTRDVSMHHHVALDDTEDFARLARFLKGTAIGLIACGGGALCTAQIGLYRAFLDAGVQFDIMGGTSGGSAYTAAFALGRGADEIEAATHEMFVKNRAMRRLTWPRYSLIDHKHFDAELMRYYGGYDIEDLWIPFFAVSTNLSQNSLHRHSTGSLWAAVRASAAIPVVLPPYYTSDGQMLVDGCLLDNVPIHAMHEMKSGPNVVMSFELPELQRFDVAYDALPSRSALLMAAMNPFHRDALPSAPGLVTVLLRSLMANRQDFTRHMSEEDVLVIPPLPDDMGFLDWQRHGEMVDLAYRWATAELEREGTAMRAWLDSVVL
ncbi:MAG: cyclic nucleotide-binding and patatin-like phospholipase domain-containing protein [Hyphomicrobiaceae bacterium]|jgi:NTE family protein